MKIEAVDLFYLSMPQILDEGDGSQDALLVRVCAGGFTGWGECEASPLTSIAAALCPLSHSACKPVLDSVLGQKLETAQDIGRIGDLVREQSLDLLQADHTLSGIDIALWDLLGKKREQPVYRLLGIKRAYAKRPYASMLFGEDAAATYAKGVEVRKQGYLACKFGWGPFGKGSVAQDADQIQAAREGLGPDGQLLIDAGTVWVQDEERAAAALPALEQAGAIWLEEPFVSGALSAYARLAKKCRTVKLAGGEGCHNQLMAQEMIDRQALGFVQIDTGRIGGITPAAAVARCAHDNGVTYVNHTFTSHLALSASLAPFAGMEQDEICEYPVEPKQLAQDITQNHIMRDENGLIHLPEAPGLGMTVNTAGLQKYLVDVEIKVGGQLLYSTPSLGE